MTDPAPAVEVDGDPAAGRVVVVHGAMDRAETFTRLARRLRDDVAVLRYDRRGFGTSADLPGPVTIDAHVADLRAVLAGRAPGAPAPRPGRPTVVLGHSLGGTVVLAAATGAGLDDVDALVVVEPAMSWEPWWPADTPSGWVVAHAGDDPVVLAEGFMRRLIGDEGWDRQPERFRAARRREGPALVEELLDMASRRHFDPARVRHPTVVVAGARSAAYHRRAAAEVGAGVPGATEVELTGAGHGCHLTHPAELAGVVLEALARVRGPGGR